MECVRREPSTWIDLPPVWVEGQLGERISAHESALSCAEIRSPSCPSTQTGGRSIQVDGSLRTHSIAPWRHRSTNLPSLLPSLQLYRSLRLEFNPSFENLLFI